jgi:competence protein ComEA
MPALTRSQLAAYALAGLVVVVLGVRFMHGQASGSVASTGLDAPASDARGAGSSPDASAVRLDPRPPSTALVHVAGAVRSPGVYRLRDGERVQDAVRRAGGPRAGADLNAINLAAKVADGQQVVVPRRGAAGAAVVAGDGAGAGAGPAAPPVSLNTATAEQLDTLDGVGPATAAKILDYRRQHGGFKSIDDLGEVPGIGPKRLAALRSKVQL